MCVKDHLSQKHSKECLGVRKSMDRQGFYLRWKGLAWSSQGGAWSSMCVVHACVSVSLSWK
jgi:hypothetical protein